MVELGDLKKLFLDTIHKTPAIRFHKFYSKHCFNESSLQRRWWCVVCHLRCVWYVCICCAVREGLMFPRACRKWVCLMTEAAMLSSWSASRAAWKTRNDFSFRIYFDFWFYYCVSCSGIHSSLFSSACQDKFTSINLICQYGNKEWNVESWIRAHHEIKCKSHNFHFKLWLKSWIYDLFPTTFSPICGRASHYLFTQVLQVGSRVKLALWRQFLQTHISSHRHRLHTHLQDSESSLETQ